MLAVAAAAAAAAAAVGHTLLCFVDWSETKSQNMDMTICMIDS
jgi:hypothetical protein